MEHGANANTSHSRNHTKRSNQSSRIAGIAAEAITETSMSPAAAIAMMSLSGNPSRGPTCRQG